jgi:hypothetical protein
MKTNLELNTIARRAMQVSSYDVARKLVIHFNDSLGLTLLQKNIQTRDAKRRVRDSSNSRFTGM